MKKITCLRTCYVDDLGGSKRQTYYERGQTLNVPDDTVLPDHFTVVGDSSVPVAGKSSGGGVPVPPQSYPADAPVQNAEKPVPQAVSEDLVNAVDDRALAGLKAMGVFTVDQFLAADQDALAAVPFITKATIAKVRAKVQA